MYLAIIATLIVATLAEPEPTCWSDSDCDVGSVCDFLDTPIATCALPCADAAVCVDRYGDFLAGMFELSSIKCVSAGGVNKCGLQECQDNDGCTGEKPVCLLTLTPVLHMCVECQVNDDCAVGVCDADFDSDNEFECVECLADSDCEEATEFCAEFEDIEADKVIPYCETKCNIIEQINTTYCADEYEYGLCDPAISYECINRECISEANCTLSYVCNMDDLQNFFCEPPNCINTYQYCGTGGVAVCQFNEGRNTYDCAAIDCFNDNYCPQDDELIEYPYPNCALTPWRAMIGPGMGTCIGSCSDYNDSYFCQDLFDDLSYLCTGELCEQVTCSNNTDCAAYPLYICGPSGICEIGCDGNQTLCDNLYGAGSGYLCQASGICAPDSCTVNADCDNVEVVGFVCGADGVCVQGCIDADVNDFCYDDIPRWPTGNVYLCNNVTSFCEPIPCVSYGNCSDVGPYACGDYGACVEGCSTEETDYCQFQDGVDESEAAYWSCGPEEKCVYDPPSGCIDDDECKTLFNDDGNYKCWNNTNGTNVCYKPVCDPNDESNQDCWKDYGWASECIEPGICTDDPGCTVNGCYSAQNIWNMVGEFTLPIEIFCNVFENRCDAIYGPISCDSDANCDTANGYICSNIEMPPDASDLTILTTTQGICVAPCETNSDCDDLWGYDDFVAITGGAPTTCNADTGQCEFNDLCDTSTDCVDDPIVVDGICLPVKFLPKYCVTMCTGDSDCEDDYADKFGAGKVTCFDASGDESFMFCDLTDMTRVPTMATKNPTVSPTDMTRVPTTNPTVSPTVSPTDMTRVPTKNPTDDTVDTTGKPAAGVERCGIFGVIAFVIVVISRMF